MSRPLDRLTRPCVFLYNWFDFFFFSSLGFSSLCNFGSFEIYAPDASFEDPLMRAYGYVLLDWILKMNFLIYDLYV
uniref:Uncharacterized protein n=1 Tax=Cucumis melo TaxID=3656 RepID=A0A9I9DLD6_CUCME